MATFYTSERQEVETGTLIGCGGEGRVFKTNLDGFAAKIYVDPSSSRQKKLRVMVANPPESIKPHNHISIAWPHSLLYDSAGKFQGFLMPYIEKPVQIINVYNPELRQEFSPDFNWKYLHAAAQHLSLVIGTLHKNDCILGDIKPQNILVNDRAKISIIDVDSFQVRDPETQALYLCTVGSDDLTPPELLGKRMSDIQQVKAHDRFRLAVVIYHLLFGYHPFGLGHWIGDGERPSTNDFIRLGCWPYKQGSPLISSDLTIPLDVLHPKLKELFLQCFNKGHQNIRLRPSASAWQSALGLAINELEQCKHVPNHLFHREHRACCWCVRAKNLNYDLFGVVAQPLNSSDSKSTVPKPPIVEPTVVLKTPIPKTYDSSSEGSGCWIIVCIAIIVAVALTVWSEVKEPDTDDTRTSVAGISGLVQNEVTL